MLTKPSSLYLKTLEQKLSEPANRRQPESILEVEKFLTTYPLIEQIKEASVPLINNMMMTAGKAHSARLVREAGAKYDKQTWRTALDYSIEGINRIQQKKCTEPFMNVQFEKTRILGELNCNAGNCALNLAKQLQNIEGSGEQKQRKNILEQAIRFYNESIELAEQINKTNVAAYTLSFRADAHKELSDSTFATDRIKNLTQAADDLSKSASVLQRSDIEHASRQYSFASRYQYTAAKLATKTPERQIDLLKSAIFNAQSAQRYQNNTDPNYRARLDYDIGKYADALFEITKQKEAAQLAILYFKKAAEHFMEHRGPKDDLEQNAITRIGQLTKAIA
jgi:hypothetical protein